MTSTIEDAIISNCKITGNCTIDNCSSYISQMPISSVITTSNIYTMAKEIVAEGLRNMNINELSEILCQKLIVDLSNKEDYYTLLKLYNNDYKSVLKILLKE